MNSINKIPVFRPTLPALDAYINRVKVIWDNRMLSNFSSNCVEMEGIARQYLGVKYTLALVSADIGLISTIKALNIPSGSEVILPAFTFNSTANAVLWNNLVPVFADIDPETLCVSADSIAEKITSSTKLIIATHTFGNPSAITQLQKLSNDNNLILIFDSAHAYGSLYQGSKIGQFGKAEIFSFSGTKLVTSAEGGILATNDKSLFESMHYIRNYGFVNDYNSKFLGINGKMSELNAALGCETLPLIDHFVEERNSIAQSYIEKLSGIGDIRFQKIEKGNLSSYKDFCILTSKRDLLSEYLNNLGIQTKKYFLPISQMDLYREFSSNLKVTDKIGRECLCIPMYNQMDQQIVLTVTKHIREFFSQ